MPLPGGKSFDQFVSEIKEKQGVTDETARKIVGAIEKRMKTSKMKLQLMALQLDTLGKMDRKYVGASHIKPKKKKPKYANKHNVLWYNSKLGKVKTASLVDEDESGKFAKYWLLNAKDTNGNGWGVTQQSIAKNIQSFINKPFVITARKWIEDSMYGDVYDHPHLPTNDMNRILSHQEHFRVGNIVDVHERDGQWFAVVARDPKYAHLNLPAFCSPAIYQLNPLERDASISKWTGLHLAGLEEDPAYGAQIAILRGSCDGPKGQCVHQLREAKQRQGIKLKKGELEETKRGIGRVMKAPNKTRFEERLFDKFMADDTDAAKQLGVIGRTRDDEKFSNEDLEDFEEGTMGALGTRDFEQDQADMDISKRLNPDKPHDVFDRLKRIRQGKIKLAGMLLAQLRSQTNQSVNRVNVLGTKKRKKPEPKLARFEEDVPISIRRRNRLSETRGTKQEHEQENVRTKDNRINQLAAEEGFQQEGTNISFPSRSTISPKIRRKLAFLEPTTTFSNSFKKKKHKIPKPRIAGLEERLDIITRGGMDVKRFKKQPVINKKSSTLEQRVEGLMDMSMDEEVGFAGGTTFSDVDNIIAGEDKRADPRLRNNPQVTMKDLKKKLAKMRMAFDFKDNDGGDRGGFLGKVPKGITDRMMQMEKLEKDLPVSKESEFEFARSKSELDFIMKGKPIRPNKRSRSETLDFKGNRMNEPTNVVNFDRETKTKSAIVRIPRKEHRESRATRINFVSNFVNKSRDVVKGQNIVPESKALEKFLNKGDLINIKDPGANKLDTDVRSKLAVMTPEDRKEKLRKFKQTRQFIENAGEGDESQRNDRRRQEQEFEGTGRKIRPRGNSMEVSRDLKKLNAKLTLTKLAVKLIKDEEIRKLREGIGPGENFPDDNMKRSPEDARRNFAIQTRGIASDRLKSLGEKTRRNNPKTPLVKEVPFGKENRPKKNVIGDSLKDEDESDAFMALDFADESNPIVDPLSRRKGFSSNRLKKPKRSEFTRIIGAKGISCMPCARERLNQMQAQLGIKKPLSGAEIVKRFMKVQTKLPKNKGFTFIPETGKIFDATDPKQAMGLRKALGVPRNKDVFLDANTRGITKAQNLIPNLDRIKGTKMVGGFIDKAGKFELDATTSVIGGTMAQDRVRLKKEKQIGGIRIPPTGKAEFFDT